VTPADHAPVEHTPASRTAMRFALLIGVLSFFAKHLG
jgi:hypothetical protein